MSVEQKVTISKVVATTNKGIDYDKLINDFGCNRITDDLILKIERLTNRPAHHFIKRGIFFSHRDLEVILNAYEKGELFYIYTGRGPSSESMHIGHLIPFIFCKYLQEAFDAQLIIQLTDDEKFVQNDITIEESYKLGKSNLKDILACGFNPEKTFVFSDLDYISGCKEFYKNILKIQKNYNFNQARAIFGFDESCNIGKVAFAAVQAAPSFSSSFPHIFGSREKVPCLIPCGIDQDPYFRLTRDISPRLSYLKPSLIHSTFLPALQGAQTKMSSSDPLSSIFLNDSPSQIEKKIKKYAFSGGKDSVEEHRKHGADLSIDVSIAYLNHFYPDDVHLEKIKQEYASGALLSGEVKKILINCLCKVVSEHQQAKNSLTDDYIQRFLQFK